MDRGFLSDVLQDSGEGKLNVEFSDVRQLQIMTDKMKRLVHQLELNCTVCQRLRSFFTRLTANLTLDVAETFRQSEVMLENIIFQQETHTSRLKIMVERATGVTSMVRYSIKSSKLYIH